LRFCLRSALGRRQNLRTHKTVPPYTRHEKQAQLLLPVLRMLADASLNVITGQIIGAAIEVHRILGPGLLESAYMPCLQFELAAVNVRFVAEHAVPILYKGLELDAKYRIDLLVENRVVVEVKSADCLLPVHQAQVLTYMRLIGCPAGLLINFNVPKLVDGVKRLINSHACGA
jgi:GxxExxY protein